ncbi:hypothetical protein M0R45_030687 [Rubus argutus]|uniref:Uncharacterized protein n=1 Tax=Rubus argutus TaxID=59490 RepID=A0AAW1WDX1_RUBAR
MSFSRQPNENSTVSHSTYGNLFMSELQCLSPTLHLSSKVLNIAAAHLYEDNSQRWFFPTYFGERAKGYASQIHEQGWVAATIHICQLQRFHRRLR